MASICSAVFPCPKITSGNPHRSRRWRSTLANPPVSWNGCTRIRCKASSDDEPPLLDVPQQFLQLMRVHRNYLGASDRIARSAGSSSAQRPFPCIRLGARSATDLSFRVRDPSVVCSFHGHEGTGLAERRIGDSADGRIAVRHELAPTKN